MNSRYVLDTTSIISYFDYVFEKPSQISEKALRIIRKGMTSDEVILIIPSIVFVEIFKKWFTSDERSHKIRYEIFEKIRLRGNIEIKPIEQEVISEFIKIRNIEANHNFDNHDKQILACAMMLQCPLITSDTNVIRYNKINRVIPETIS